MFKILYIYIYSTTRHKETTLESYNLTIKHGTTYRITIRLIKYFDRSCTDIMQISMTNQTIKLTSQIVTIRNNLQMIKFIEN